jgi:hypothetical protein
MRRMALTEEINSGPAATKAQTRRGRAHIEQYLADTPPSQRALKFFDWVVDWAASKDFRGCPLQHTVTELTDAAHPARLVAHAQREWFAERFLEWTKAAGVKEAKTTARALMVLFDGAVAGSEVDGPQRGERRSMARQAVAGRLNALWSAAIVPGRRRQSDGRRFHRPNTSRLPRISLARTVRVMDPSHRAPF